MSGLLDVLGKGGGQGQSRAGQGRAGQGRAKQGRAGQGRAGQGRAGAGAGQGQGRAGQGRAGRAEKHSFAASCTLPCCRDAQPGASVGAASAHANGQWRSRWGLGLGS